MAAPARVGVLTFHRCINYGSYWQARCLAEGLRERGLDAVLLDHRSRRVDRAEWACALSPHLPERTGADDRRLYARKVRRFAEAFERTLPLSAPFLLEQPEAAGAWDAIVVGSDEVWNLRHPWYAGKRLFFGDGLRSGRLVSYAASAGSHDADTGLSKPWTDHLRRFLSLSVRDENTRRLIRTALGVDPSVVLDPCLQFPKLLARATGGSDEVVVYGHGFPDWFVRRAVEWARARSVRLVSFGYRNAWCDASRLDAGPEEFAEVLAGARAVITNFFHGSIFSILYRRPFVCALTPYRANKVQDLAERLGAQAHLMTAVSDAAAYARALENPPGEAVIARLDELRTSSSAYLDTALAGL